MIFEAKLIRCQSPDQHDPKMEMHRSSYDSACNDSGSPASSSHHLSKTDSLNSIPSLEDAELLSQLRSGKSALTTRMEEVSMQEVQPVLPPIQLLSRFLPPPFAQSGPSVPASYGQEEPRPVPQFLLPPLRDIPEPSCSSTFFQHGGNP